ncbi:MAG: hypothetical protein A3A96_00180 [Candidatus Zambryskibacteria bacterium RIFCSPLOWO2_01_FULL_39_39]|uniref:Uncharacterized protein n=1 Tax=Candidatus Zambryskibacteria bacterium RIFCSPLOWO2_01_FULL_39_39 TaxID=1802758 RepID=A0A1G2TX15_9BACT|nr:MAG: hypothetical protein UT00_C0001G0065 [Parcubacteria group bacterium GW2011_GWA1_38_7]OHA87872.1 MAG: hypothetical protein A2644_01715 [Candidatus Zambryskibacteria bacterium RIFCSPHIGHO2_01_FULL_39_63]OHA94904.1 MAG: hypothetical protein A3B88_00800 [Candidatus Zambryskibacteria bacterium RIFCSPHIGHO2_02_FULL_39_19]OHA99084.1 MAG: hypothetical protein A3F20_02750 [Candidatus Zambryskibacteria bacterium RIFCSPHIGHO2_12_FULL_39_21]OHB01845.1 MAG: hypothetical protein A3A96_00180 [Candidat
MFTITYIFGVVAGIISFGAYIVYIISILKGETKPSRATWWILTIVGSVTGISYYFSGAVDTIWVPVADVFGIFIVAILSIKYGEGGLNPFDITCFFVSMTGLVLWYIFKSPVIALILNLSMDFVGMLPTIKKSYLEPTGESGFSWLLTFIGNVLNFGAIGSATFGVLIYPIYMSITSGSVATLLYFPKTRFSKKIK